MRYLPLLLLSAALSARLAEPSASPPPPAPRPVPSATPAVVAKLFHGQALGSAGAAPHRRAMPITFHLARADNGVIGRDGQLPWRLPADLKRFKAQTLGRPMIMGRKTFESFPAPLPGRRHIVLTRDRGWSAPGAEVAHTPEDALALAGEDAAVIGGAEVFALFLDRAARIDLTEVHATPEGDAIVPPFVGWREVAREAHPAEDERPAYSFVTLARS